jgi:hypothetical protein
MQLALEYLIRTGLVREWFKVPCSLFLNEHGTFSKLAITITEEFKPSEFYSVKHWHVGSCKNHQALPSFTEHRVPKSDVFTHPSVIIPNHSLLPYFVSPIPSTSNSYNHPMLAEIYNHYYDNFLESKKHRELKINWLWREVVLTYIPTLLHGNYIDSYNTEAENAAGQRQFIGYTHPEIWQCWGKWVKYILFLDGVPAELIFYGEFCKQGGSCVNSVSYSPSFLASSL